MPGFEEGAFSVGIRGAGGGGGNGDDDGGGWTGDAPGMGTGMEAFFLRCWILSL